MTKGTVRTGFQEEATVSRRGWDGEQGREDESAVHFCGGEGRWGGGRTGAEEGDTDGRQGRQWVRGKS